MPWWRSNQSQPAQHPPTGRVPEDFSRHKKHSLASTAAALMNPMLLLMLSWQAISPVRQIALATRASTQLRRARARSARSTSEQGRRIFAAAAEAARQPTAANALSSSLPGDALRTLVGAPPPWRPGLGQAGTEPPSPEMQIGEAQRYVQQLGRSLPGPDGIRAHRSLYAALDDDHWLETKFERSGAPKPGEGELTVVIEYCYNSGESYAQLSTKHGEARYHEEAELVRQYFLNYHSVPPRARAAVRLPDSQGAPRGAVGRVRGRRAPSRRRPPRYIQSLVEALLWPLATVAGLAGWREANDPNLSAAPEAVYRPPRRLAALLGRARPGRQPRRLPHAPRHISLRRRRGHRSVGRRRLN